MSDNTRPQTWEIINQKPLLVLETGDRESLDNAFDILDSKLNFPFRVSLTGSVITVHESEFQTYRSDGSEWGGTLNSFKVATSPIQGMYKVLGDSTLSMSNGLTTGDFSTGVTSSCPALFIGQYIWLALLVNTSGKIGVSWGNPHATLSLATYPTFPEGTAICLIKLKANSNNTAGIWGSFETVLPEDIIMFKGSGGGGSGGSTDFVPVYKSSTEYRFVSTQGRQVRFNERYFSIAEDLDFYYGSTNGRYYICLDTNKTYGVISDSNKSTYFVTTQLDPNSESFPLNLVALGWYTVSSGLVSQTDLGVYSTREVDTLPPNLHFVPYLLNTSTCGINTTQGRFSLINGRYYGLDHDVSITLDTAHDGMHYICLNTGVIDSFGNSASGLIPTYGNNDSDFFVITQKIPGTNDFDPHYAALGQYNVISGILETDSFQGYSTREIISWVYGLPNIKRKFTTDYSFGFKTFAHNLDTIPSSISYHYYHASTLRFEEIDRYSVENSFDKTTVDYTLPHTPSFPWDAGDYVITEVLSYDYSTDGGFASPKTDYTTGWFFSTPASTLPHSLVDRPKNITLEFNDTIKNTFWVEDGNQYIDKNMGGLEGNQVSFDWTSLPVLSNSLKMRITMNLSKTSAGSFVAGKLERGVVSTTGGLATAITPDLILTSADTNFAHIINQSITGNIKVLVTESIQVTSTQEITVPNVSFDMIPGTYIDSGVTSLTSVVKLSGTGYEVENIRILSSADTGDGLEINAEGIVKNCLIKHDGQLGGKFESAIRVNLNVVTGDAFLSTIIGRTECVNGGVFHYIINEASSASPSIHDYHGELTPSEGDMRPKIVVSGKYTTAYRKS